MSNVEQLIKTDKVIIEILEAALKDAKNGGFVALAVACVFNDGGTKSAFRSNDEAMALLGVLTVVQRDIMDCCVESRKDNIGM